MSMTPSIHPVEQGHIFRNFIAGEWRESRGGKMFSSTNPADTREIVGHFQQSTRADLEEAVAAARKAQPVWAATPAPERGELLLRTIHFQQRPALCLPRHTRHRVRPGLSQCLHHRFGDSITLWRYEGQRQWLSRA